MTGVLPTLARSGLLLAIGIAAVWTPAAQAQDNVVRSFAAGSGPAAAGTITSDAGEDTEEEGPQAIATSQDGKLLLLDQVNARILSFDPKQPSPAPQVLALPGRPISS
jgi:hypothetical protein